MKALFVILDYADYNTKVISDLIGNPSVAYHKRYSAGDSIIYRVINKARSLPEGYFGSWYSALESAVLFGSKSRLSSVCPVLLVYECNSLARNKSLLDGLKQRIPQLKLVLILTNIVGSKGSPESHLNVQREVFDLIITFSEDDAEQYGLMYYEGMYSSLSLQGLRGENEDYDYDLYFCGRDKGRTYLLETIARTLDLHLVSYRFDIIGESKLKRHGFHYQDSLIPNDEMLRRASRAKTALEIMADPENRGSSLRPYESYALGMKLLSNNRYLVDKPWFNPKQISIIDEAGQFDIDFVRTPIDLEDTQDISILSPVRFLEFISDKLCLQIGET